MINENKPPVSDYETGFNDGWEEAKENAQDRIAELEVPAAHHFNMGWDKAIERCAQVVKQWIDEVGASQDGRDLNTLLAAIRALKDKP